MAWTHITHPQTSNNIVIKIHTVFRVLPQCAYVRQQSYRELLHR